MLAKQSADELKVALSPVHPPFLWLGSGQTAASLKDALAPYFLSYASSEEKLERTMRGFLGTGGPQLGLIQLHDAYQDVDFVDAPAWGSASEEDRYLDTVPRRAQGQTLIRRDRDQDPAGLDTFSFRSLFSKPVLRAESHANLAPGVHIFIAL